MYRDEEFQSEESNISPMEFVAKSLEEIRFWSRIMKEHSLFLRLGFRAEDIRS